MLHTVLAAHRAELIQCPEQQAFEFADCPAPAADRWAALPMRCPGRENYLLWKEGRGLDVVIELTSKTTMIEDIEEKYNLYVSKLGVKEYFLFDPEEEYLTPSFQGYRRTRSRFQPIRAVAGRA